MSSNDPAVKIPAIQRVVEKGDSSALPVLVKDLASSDPAVRFYAIEALQRFAAGDTMGYVFYASDEERAPAIKRWQDWLAEQQGQAPADPAAGSAPTR